MRRRRALGGVAYELRVAWRTLLRKPGLTITSIATLGLGIGASAAVFTVVYGVLLKPLPYPQPERLVGLFRVIPELMGPNPPVSRLAGWYAVPFPVYLDWQKSSRSFESVGAYRTPTFTVTGTDRSENVDGVLVTSGVFTALGVRPFIGRTLLTDDDQPGAPGRVVLSYGFWHSRLGADTSVVGTELVLNGTPHLIVGVMPARFGFPDGGEQLWANFGDDDKTETDRLAGNLQVLARLTPGLSVEVAQNDMEDVDRRLVEVHPEETEFGVSVGPLMDMTVGDVRAGLLLLLGAVGAVLLIACANIANLLLVRATERRREIGLRHALGAGRARLLIQLLSESLLLSIFGGAVGIVVATVSVGPLVAAFPGGLVRAEDVAVDYRALGFTLALSLLTGLLVGGLPALRSCTTAMTDALQDVGRGASGGRRRHRVQSLLVVSEIALSFLLLTSAGLFIRSFTELNSVERGFVSDDLLVTRLVLPDSYRSGVEAPATFFRRLTERLASVPGVQAVATASQMPFSGGISVPPTSIDTGTEIVETSSLASSVTPSYFHAMSIPLVAGRLLDSADRPDSPLVAVVNQTLARQYWLDESPLGRRVRVDLTNDAQWRTVVGVVGDVRSRLQSDPFPAVYVPYAQDALWCWYQTVIIKSDIDPTLVTAAARDGVRNLDPDVPAQVEELDEKIRHSSAIANGRFAIFLLGGLAVAAAALALLGIYGVLAYTVAQRTREIGIRVALGARRGAVARAVVGRGLALAVVGLGIGSLGSLLAARVMESMLFEVSPTDPATLLSTALLVMVATLAASCIPACRAIAVQPVEALRSE